MKRVVGVSLGSASGDASSCVEILGEEFEISRVGTNGDMDRFAELLREYDGKVDAIGLGGIDRYLYTEKRRYTIRDADRLARNAKKTPVVDGSGVKNTLERKTIEYLQENGIVDFTKSKVLVVCAVDRFGMAQAIGKLAKDVVYGDLMFNVGIPLPLRSYRALCLVGDLLLPIVARVPFQWIYPTGDKQDETKPKCGKYYRWADVIVGDKHIIRRTIPTVESGVLKGKTIITNTITAADQQMLTERGVRTLVTATPEYGGRRYGTNVLEGVLVALLGKRPEDLTPADYEELLVKMDWRPTVTVLSSAT